MRQLTYINYYLYNPHLNLMFVVVVGCRRWTIKKTRAMFTTWSVHKNMTDKAEVSNFKYTALFIFGIEL